MGLIQNGVLAVLARNPGDHAYSVWQSLNTSASAEPVRLASVYMAVKRMKEMGVIRERDAGDFSEWGSLSQSERVRIPLELTADGQARYERWRAETPATSDDLVLRLAFVMPDDDLAPLIAWATHEQAQTQRALAALPPVRGGPLTGDWSGATALMRSRLAFAELSARALWLAEVASQLRALQEFRTSAR